MPNWCWNSVTFEGDKQTIDKIQAAAATDGFFNELHPMPKELEGTTSPSESGLDWYNWCINNWGTKWDAQLNDSSRDGDTSFTLYFDTAWGPPIEFYRHMIENYNVEVDAEFEESGMGFVGYFNNEEGEETWEYYDIFEKHGDRWSEHIPERFHDVLESMYESWKEWREDDDLPDPKTDKSVS